MTPIRCLSAALCLATTLTLAGCGSSTDLPKVQSVTVSPGSTTLVSLGETAQLSATALKGSGTSVSSASFSWSSSASTVASVSGSGLVTAIGNGTATITAVEAGGTSGSTTITVDQEAAEVALALAGDTLQVGSTVQATAEATDAGGNALAAPVFTWSSSDTDVATVDGEGLITALSDGEAEISASLHSSSGTASLLVIRPDLTLLEDTILAGSVEVEDFSVPENVNVTLSGDLELDVTGAFTMAGTLTGDCTEIQVQGEGSVAISGTVNNACGDEAMAGENGPGISIDAPGGVNLTDATLVSSGPVTVVSEPSSQLLQRMASRAGSRHLNYGTQTHGTVSLEGATIRGEPTEAPQPASAEGPYPNGANIEFRASVELIINGTTMAAQHGGSGVAVSKTSANNLEVNGGRGGAGGNIIINLPQAGVMSFRSTRGASQLMGGNGGPGGPATATTTENPGVDPAPSAKARGGRGGRGGSITLLGPATVQEGSDIGLIGVQVGLGGRGGNATAVAASGVDASDTRDAQVGGTAIATGGYGGDAGMILSDFEGMPAPDGKEGGSGGVARATAGHGGSGIRTRPNGAVGGEAQALGGEGGNSTETGGREGADAIVDGGNGGEGANVCPATTDNTLAGQISVNSDPASSDQFIFNAGSGTGLGLLFSILSTAGGPGGDGGAGGLLTAVGGRGGMGRNVNAPKGVGSIGSGGNGGDGGAGVPGGSGGSAGAAGKFSDADAQLSNPVFQEGQAGGECPSSVSSPLLTFAAGEGTLTMTLTGNAPWVDVTGTLAEDGTVTGTGRGTVAGTPDILVEFSGSWDSATKTLQGTYTIDSEKVISAGHPVVYDVNVSGG